MDLITSYWSKPWNYPKFQRLCGNYMSHEYKDNHLWEDRKGVIHLCDGSRLVDSDKNTYVVWTICEIDVPANESFKSEEQPTCAKCMATTDSGREG